MTEIFGFTTRENERGSLMELHEMRESAIRVARGAVYMDVRYPGWERKIDLSILDIEDPNSCICGQVIDYNGWGIVSHDLPSGQSTEHGFADGRDGDAWVMLIKERFDSGCLSDAGAVL